jgi:hypothetical protein
MEVPMLDEEEFAEIALLYSEAIEGVKRFREASGADLKHPAIEDFFRQVQERYEQQTGCNESNQNAIMHHRLSLYGSPCGKCGKLLRTPNAKLCGTA